MRLFLAAGLAVLLAAPVAATAGWFPDVPDDHPDKASIDWAVAEGLFRGYVDGDFRPDRELTEGQFNLVIRRLFERYDGWTRAETARFLHRGVGPAAPPAFITAEWLFRGGKCYLRADLTAPFRWVKFSGMGISWLGGAVGLGPNYIYPGGKVSEWDIKVEPPAGVDHRLEFPFPDSIQTAWTPELEAVLADRRRDDPSLTARDILEEANPYKVPAGDGATPSANVRWDLPDLVGATDAYPEGRAEVLFLGHGPPANLTEEEAALCSPDIDALAALVGVG